MNTVQAQTEERELLIPQFVCSDNKSWYYIDKEEYERRIREDERLIIKEEMRQRKIKAIWNVIEFSKDIGERIVGAIIIAWSLYSAFFTDLFRDNFIASVDGTFLFITIPLGLSMLFGIYSKICYKVDKD